MNMDIKKRKKSTVARSSSLLSYFLHNYHHLQMYYLSLCLYYLPAPLESKGREVRALM